MTKDQREEILDAVVQMAKAIALLERANRAAKAVAIEATNNKPLIKDNIGMAIEACKKEMTGLANFLLDEEL